MLDRVSYAQYGEDITLAALLNTISHGFYVDVGANYETQDSVTKYFYANGWRGINIEPIPQLFDELSKKRKRDINLNIGVSRKKQKLLFSEFETHGHSTFSKDSVGSETSPRREYMVHTEPLKSIFKRYHVETIHFLKIDVEGFESDVIASNDWNIYRPYVVCVEANHVSVDWRPILVKVGYRLFIVDGLNEYYVAHEHWDELTEGFAERAVALRATFIRKDQYEIYLQQEKTIDMLKSDLDGAVKKTHQYEAEARQLAETSYLGKPFRSRVRLAAYSIFIDWIRQKLSKSSK